MKNTVATFKKMKNEGTKISMLTAYDYSTAKLVDEAGINSILVGDSLGMVMLGYEDTLSVTMEDMIHHTAAVARGAKNALVVGDMPFMSYEVSVEQAVINAGRLMKEGRANAVKLEGGVRVAEQIKAITKAGIPVAPGIAIESGDEIDIDHIVEVCGERCFVKPAVNGSSYGISLVHEPSELPAAIKKAFEYGDKVLVEKCIEGTEITVGVYGEDDVRALPIVEIRKPEDCEFYDLDVKYVDPTDIHRIPAQISPENYARAQELACAAHKALGCLGISRSDFIVSEDGPVILETNTIPGMTDTSLYPDEIRHTDDMTFPQVCDSLIRMGLRRAGVAC